MDITWHCYQGEIRNMVLTEHFGCSNGTVDFVATSVSVDEERALVMDFPSIMLIPPRL